MSLESRPVHQIDICDLVGSQYDVVLFLPWIVDEAANPGDHTHWMEKLGFAKGDEAWVLLSRPTPVRRFETGDRLKGPTSHYNFGCQGEAEIEYGSGDMAQGGTSLPTSDNYPQDVIV